MKRKAIVAICLSLAILASVFAAVQVVYAPWHWGGGRNDIKPAPVGTPNIAPCPWNWGGGRIDIKPAPVGEPSIQPCPSHWGGGRIDI
jgi:hypothetical protein